MPVAALAKLEANAPAIARTLRVFANEHRVRILCYLAASRTELPFAVLAAGMAISQSALSQHLNKLCKAGLIGARRAGHNSFYRLTDARALQLAIGLQKILKGGLPSPDDPPA
jgi:DNA-binding transcriptional ArsR family regulator